MRKKELTYVVELGDCVEQLLKRPKGFAGLVCADPPYNQGMPYDAFDDNQSYDEYMAWTRRWIGAVVQHALAPNGSLWIFIPDEWVSEIDMMCRHEFKLYKRRHVVWTFTFGQAAQNNFSRSHCHVLYFTRKKTKFTFNDKAIRVPSARQLMYNDKRANAAGKMPDATWMLLKHQLEEYMGEDKDVWLESRVCGTFRERKKHSPNQIPVPIMERIVKACSNPGDIVYDPFVGTGSTGVACANLGRSFLGVDISALCVAESKGRIQDALGTVRHKGKKV